MRKGDGARGALIAVMIVVGLAGGALADPEGTWLTKNGKSHVAIYPCDEKLCGEIVWLREPHNADGSEKLDIHNEDESLRDRPIMGLRILTDLSDAGDGEWEDGEIYNPEDGETYRSELELLDSNTLKVRGCVFFFCKTQTWTRVE